MQGTTSCDNEGIMYAHSIMAASGMNTHTIAGFRSFSRISMRPLGYFVSNLAAGIVAGLAFRFIKSG